MSMQNYSTKQVNVLIAIQARSNSTRFPGKIFELIGKKTVLQHVIDAAASAKFYIEQRSKKSNARCEIAVLHPEGDSNIVSGYKQSATLIAGDEHDVLSRFIKAKDLLKFDYVVRLTSDCPMVLDYIISKHINTAIYNNLDYVSNVQEECRQIADGFDVEIMSAKALDWLNENATTKEEREHVSIAIRTKSPTCLDVGYISSRVDSSKIKMSLDTPEDLERIRAYYHEREFKIGIAKKKFNIYGPHKTRIYEI